MALKYTNNASSTITSAINSSVTTITLATGEGAEFPTLSAGDYFYGTLVDTNAGTTEIVKVTARSSDTLTVVRGQDNTTAASWDAGTRFDLKVCAALLTDLAPVTSVAGKTGAVTLAKADVGLGNVDNTSDADKPVSTATQTALDAKQALDADLTAIAALAGTSGLLKKTAADTWSLEAPPSPASQLVWSYQGAIGGYTLVGTNEAVVTNSVNLSSGNVFYFNANFGPTNFVCNYPSGPAFSMTFILDGVTSFTWTGWNKFNTTDYINVPVTFKWPGGTAPTLTGVAGKLDTFVFITRDGGVTWYGFTAGLNS